MIVANRALLVVTPVLYLVTLFAYWLSNRNVTKVPRRLPLLLLAVTFLAHGGLLAARGQLIHQLPWTSWHDVVLALAFVMTTTYLLVEVATGVSATGSDILSVPFAMTLYAAAIGHHVPVAKPALDTPLFAMHTVPAIGGIGAILVGGLYGVLYLRLAYAIRAKRFGAFFSRMPDLEILGRMNFRAGAIGFLLVTAAIGWGATWYGNLFEHVDLREPKIYLTLAIWSVLLVVVVGRAIRMVPDRVTAIVSVVTMGLVVFFVTVLPFVAIR